MYPELDKFLELASESEPKFGPVGNQSIRTTLKCGCTCVYHKYAAKAHLSDESNRKRSYWVELCKEHAL